jgi:hypothetical protein
MLKKLLLLFVLFTNLIFAQNIQLSEKSEVSVLTCDRGDQLYSTFGHTALRIVDNNNNLDVVYNYGAFDFRTENFYLKFVKGDLQYFMNVTSYEEFIYEYQMDNREVIEQKINLSIDQRNQLFNLLNKNLYSTERYYTYKFIDRNCTNMVSNKINEVLGNESIVKVDDKTITYRQLLYPYFENYFWYKLGINIVFGEITDKKAEKLFLPIELLNSLDQLSVNNKPFVQSKETVVKANKTTYSFSFLNSIYGVVILLLLLLISKSKKIYFSYLFINGLLGIILCLIGLYSLHEELLWNYNALLFNPLLLLIPFVSNNYKVKLLFIYLVLLVPYTIILINKPHLLLMLPFIFTNIIIVIYLRRKLLTTVK